MGHVWENKVQNFGAENDENGPLGKPRGRYDNIRMDLKLIR
jgi:hypothetical protein